MNLEKLKEDVFLANMKLVEYGLVTLTWGNVSAIERSEGLIIIKPSGIEYKKMKIEDMVVVDMDGNLVDGKWRPSSDTPTHIELYKAFPQIGGISHAHSVNATIFAQAELEIPCLGTTHADHFYGNIPLTRVLSKTEVENGYEKYTGKVIVERFANLDPLSFPGVLVACHAPFAWGKSAAQSVEHSLIMERIAELAIGTFILKKEIKPINKYIMDKHFSRKHGPQAYYGQENN